MMLRPEFRFVLAATRWPHDHDALATIAEAAAAVRDLDRMAALARSHHVIGLVARAMARCDVFAGTTVRRDLQREALALAEEQFRQLIQTRRAVDALRGAGIAVAVLKGAPSALAIYGEAGVRCSVDIDLLIARTDLERAAGVIAAIGYERSEPPHGATARQIRASLQYGKDWGFDHFDSDTGIELHWRLFQNPRLLGRIGVDDAVERMVSPGITLPMLPPRPTALYLVAHGAEHAWARLKWLADLAALLRRDPTTADRLLEDASKAGLDHMTATALLLASELYRTSVPGPAANLAREWRTRTLLDIARASLLGDQDGVELEQRPMATTRKNLGHYLFSRDPRYWWQEMAYDLFHDADGNPAGRWAKRAANLMRLPAMTKI